MNAWTGTPRVVCVDFLNLLLLCLDFLKLLLLCLDLARCGSGLLAACALCASHSLISGVRFQFLPCAASASAVWSSPVSIYRWHWQAAYFCHAQAR